MYECKWLIHRSCSLCRREEEMVHMSVCSWLVNFRLLTQTSCCGWSVYNFLHSIFVRIDYWHSIFSLSWLKTSCDILKLPYQSLYFIRHSQSLSTLISVRLSIKWILRTFRNVKDVKLFCRTSRWPWLSIKSQQSASWMLLAPLSFLFFFGT